MSDYISFIFTQKNVHNPFFFATECKLLTEALLDIVKALATMLGAHFRTVLLLLSAFHAAKNMFVCLLGIMKTCHV